jgi:hypothetical protein
VPFHTFSRLIKVNNRGDAPAQDISIRDWPPEEVSNMAVLEAEDGWRHRRAVDTLLQGSMILGGDSRHGLQCLATHSHKAVSLYFATAVLLIMSV